MNYEYISGASDKLWESIKSDFQTQVIPDLEYLREKHDFPAGECAQTRLPESVKDIVHAVPSLLSECPGVLETQLSFQTIRRLGQRKTEDDKNDSKSCDAMLGMLAQQRRPFALRCSSDEMESCFSIGMPEAVSGVAGKMLQGAFGIADLEKSSFRPVGKAEYARCECVLMDAESLRKALDAGRRASWPDLAARAALGCSASLTLTFTPIGEAWLNGQISRVHEALDTLARYEDMTIQFSGGFGGSKDESTSLAKGIREDFGRKEKIHANPTLTASQSVKSTLSQLHGCIKQLEYRLTELEQCRRGGGWSVSVCVQGDELFGREMLKVALGSSMVQLGCSCRWQEQPCQAMILPAFRLAEAAYFPTRSLSGLKIEELHEYEINPPDVPGDEEGFDLGNVVWGNTVLKRKLRISSRAFNRHAFVCGMTGSGKSNTVCHLLSCLKTVPFMVVEPVKGEYRTLAKTIENTKVFTLDAGSSEQLPINPFWFPEGSSLQYHIGCLLDIISAAFDLYAAMPNILQQCLVRVYTRLGWNLITNRNSFSDDLPMECLYPTFDMLCAEVKDYLDKNFDEGELKNNYSNALLSRLRTFTRGTTGVLLNQAVKTPLKEWDEGGCNVIIELDALNDDDKSIVMGALIAQYYQYIKYCRKAYPGEKLRHIFVLEEAHHLFAAESHSSNGNDSRRKLVETLNNMLTGIRAYGEGFIIVDQSPSSVSKEVQKNTNVKIVHNVNDGEDVKNLQSALLLKENDRFPAKLNVGQALVRFNGMDLPVLTQIERCEVKDTHVFTKDALSATSYTAATLQDMALSDKDFMEKMKQSCRFFVNQALYSESWEIEEAFNVLMNSMAGILVEFGFHDMLRDVPASEFYLPVLSRGVSLCLAEDAGFRNQARFSRMLAFYVQRILELFADSAAGISDGEWALMEEYRRAALYSALAWHNSYNPEYASLMRIQELKDAGWRMNIVKKLIDGLYDSECGACAVNWNDDEPFSDILSLVEEKVKAMNLFLVAPGSFCVQLTEDLLAWGRSADKA